MYVHHPLEYVGPISPHEIIQAKQELRVIIFFFKFTALYKIECLIKHYFIILHLNI